LLNTVFEYDKNNLMVKIVNTFFPLEVIFVTIGLKVAVFYELYIDHSE